MGKAEDVVGKYMEEFPESGELGKRPGIEQVEQVMRPFAPISHDVQRQIDHLFRERGTDSLSTGEHCWWEADFAVSGDGPHHVQKQNFLVMDPCTCVIPHLEAAIEHARVKDVDPRLIKLRDMWVGCGRDELAFHKLT